MKNKQELLREKLNRMTTLKNDDDKEAAFGYADDILLEVIEILAKRTQYRNIANQIVEAWKEVPRW